MTETVPAMPREGPRARLAIALVAAAVVLFQIGITRVLSVVLWYHWAFLAVSMAMLGLGVPGVWFALRPPGPQVLGRCLCGAAAALPLAVLGILHHAHLGGGRYSVVVCMLFMLAPMLLLGAAVCALLLAAPGARVGRMYGADLIGASIAALVVVPAMWLVPTPQLVAVAGLLPLAAHMSLRPSSARPMLFGAAVLFGLCLRPDAFALRYAKNYDEAALAPQHVQWTPTARLAFFDRPLSTSGDTDFGWGAGTRAPRQTPEQRWMEQDGCAGTPITRFDGDLAGVEHLFYDVTSVVYQLGAPRRTAVIGAGGGRDVLSALLGGSAAIDAVELNAAVVATVRGPYGAFAGHLYDRPDVAVHIAEGRSFLTRSAGDYDVVQISLIDSWAATAAGAFSLAENNLYTVEAYRLYWRCLSERGIVTTSRWAHNFESLRLLGIHLAALRAEGVEEPRGHVAAVNAGRVTTMLLGRRPFAGELLERLRAVCTERGFTLVHPSVDLDPRIATFMDTGQPPDPRFDLSPSTDDRPFFFQLLPPLRRADPAFASGLGANAEAVRALQVLVVAVSAIALVLFFAPFLLRRAALRGPGFWRGSLFFAAIGAGFMLLEMPWLQRFVLFLGHPSHAAATVLGALLAGTGIGAMGSARVGLPRLQRHGLLLPLALLAAHLAQPAVFAATLGAPLAARLCVAVLLLLPVGCALGLLFPLGMVRFGDAAKPWFWAVNGAAGVFASVGSLLLAMQFGFTAVGAAGIACYVLAVLLLGRPRPGRRQGGGR